MADTYYAWSRFKVDVNEWGQVTKWILPGDTVTQKTVGASDGDWEEMIRIGAVRTEHYPDIPDSQSPAEYWKEQLSKSTSSSREMATAADTTPVDDKPSKPGK